MKKVVLQMKRTLSAVLAIMMVATSVPQAATTVFAADDQDFEIVEQSIDEEVLESEDVLAVEEADAAVAESADVAVEESDVIIEEPDSAYVGDGYVKIDASSISGVIDGHKVNSDGKYIGNETSTDTAVVQSTNDGDQVTFVLVLKDEDRFKIPKVKSIKLDNGEGSDIDLVNSDLVKVVKGTGEYADKDYTKAYYYVEDGTGKKCAAFDFTFKTKVGSDVAPSDKPVVIELESVEKKKATITIGKISDNKIVADENITLYTDDTLGTVSSNGLDIVDVPMTDANKTFGFTYTYETVPLVKNSNGEYIENRYVVGAEKKFEIYDPVADNLKYEVIAPSTVKVELAKKTANDPTITDMSIDGSVSYNGVTGKKVLVKVTTAEGYIPEAAGLEFSYNSSESLYQADYVVDKAATLQIATKFDSANYKPLTVVSGNTIASYTMDKAPKTDFVGKNESGKPYVKVGTQYKVTYTLKSGETTSTKNVIAKVNGVSVEPTVNSDNFVISFTPATGVASYKVEGSVADAGVNKLTIKWDTKAIKSVKYATIYNSLSQNNLKAITNANGTAVTVPVVGTVYLQVETNTNYKNATAAISGTVDTGFEPSKDSTTGLLCVPVAKNYSGRVITISATQEDTPYNIILKANDSVSKNAVTARKYQINGGAIETVSENGLIPTKVTENDTVTLKFDVKPGYKVDPVTFNGESKATDASGTVSFTAPLSNVDLTAEYTVAIDESKLNKIKFKGNAFRAVSVNKVNGKDVTKVVTDTTFGPDDVQKLEFKIEPTRTTDEVTSVKLGATDLVPTDLVPDANGVYTVSFDDADHGVEKIVTVVTAVKKAELTKIKLNNKFAVNVDIIANDILIASYDASPYGDTWSRDYFYNPSFTKTANTDYEISETNLGKQADTESAAASSPVGEITVKGPVGQKVTVKVTPRDDSWYIKDYLNNNVKDLVKIKGAVIDDGSKTTTAKLPYETTFTADNVGKTLVIDAEGIPYSTAEVDASGVGTDFYGIAFSKKDTLVADHDVQYMFHTLDGDTCMRRTISENSIKVMMGNTDVTDNVRIDTGADTSCFIIKAKASDGLAGKTLIVTYKTYNPAKLDTTETKVTVNVKDALKDVKVNNKVSGNVIATQQAGTVKLYKITANPSNVELKAEKHSTSANGIENVAVVNVKGVPYLQVVTNDSEAAADLGEQTVIISEFNTAGITPKTFEFKINKVAAEIGEFTPKCIDHTCDSLTFALAQKNMPVDTPSGYEYFYECTVKKAGEAAYKPFYVVAAYKNQSITITKDRLYKADGTAVDVFGMGADEIEYTASFRLIKAKYKPAPNSYGTDDYRGYDLVKATDAITAPGKTDKCFYEYNLKLKKNYSVIYRDQDLTVATPVWSKTTSVRKLNSDSDKKVLKLDGVDVTTTYGSYVVVSDSGIEVNSFGYTDPTDSTKGLPVGKYEITVQAVNGFDSTTKANNVVSSATYKFEIKDRYYHLEATPEKVVKLANKAATIKVAAMNDVAVNNRITRSSVKLTYDLVPNGMTLEKLNSLGITINKNSGLVTVARNAALTKNVTFRVVATYNDRLPHMTSSGVHEQKTAVITVTPFKTIVDNVTVLKLESGVYTPVDSLQVGETYYVASITSGEKKATYSSSDFVDNVAITCSDKTAVTDDDGYMLEIVPTKKGNITFTAKVTDGSGQKNVTKRIAANYKDVAKYILDSVNTTGGIATGKVDESSVLYVNIDAEDIYGTSIGTGLLNFNVTGTNVSIITVDKTYGNVYFTIKDASKPFTLAVNDLTGKKLKVSRTYPDFVTNAVNTKTKLAGYKQTVGLFNNYDFDAAVTPQYPTFSVKAPAGVDPTTAKLKFDVDYNTWTKSKNALVYSTYSKLSTLLGSKEATYDSASKTYKLNVSTLESAGLNPGSYKVYAKLVDASGAQLTRPLLTTIRVQKPVAKGRLSIGTTLKMSAVSGNEVATVAIKSTGNTYLDTKTYQADFKLLNYCNNKGVYNNFTDNFDVVVDSAGNVKVYFKSATGSLKIKDANYIAKTNKDNLVGYLQYHVLYGLDANGKPIDSGVKTVKITISPVQPR